MTSFEEFANELKAFDGRKEIINQIRRDLRKPMPAFRRKVRTSALSLLPGAGGLNEWVAKSRMTVVFRDRGRSAGFKIKLSRKNTKGKAALDALDTSGQVRHPLYGNRRHWYSQQVASLFFTTVFEKEEWIEVADAAFDKALDKIRNG